MGIADAELDQHGYVYATIPANTGKAVPVICFCSHMDTAPDFTGTGVKPQIHRDYAGGDIALPGDTSRVIRVSEHPALADQIGNDIVTSDGTTLLGADDKAGLAEIMAAAEYLLGHPEVKHGAIRILFTPDEEIGRGVDKVDIAKLGAAFGYTIDGETAGDIEDETFSADGVEIAIRGVAMHPGFAKDRMENAIKIAGEIVARLPQGHRAGDDRGQGGLHSPGRRHRLDGPGQAQLHHPRFRGGRPRREGTAARGHRPRRDRRLPGLDLHVHGQGAVPQHEGGARPASRRSSRTPSRRSAAPG